jgi:methionyl-tRNA synthetase
MTNEPNKFYLTTPIYYVNARPHIGHAYTTIVADVLARRHRLLGDDTFFLTGTDEHGQKIERSAAAAGVPPQQFADQVSKSFEDLWKRMGITNDAFIRTTDPRHIQGAQKLFADLYSRGQIYLSSYTGQYSIGEEMFVEGPPGTLGPDGRPTETVTEENFFFRLSNYQLPLLNLIESNQLLITPDSSRNEVLSFIRGDVTSSVHHPKGHAGQKGDPEVRSGILARTEAQTLYVPGALRDISVSRSSFTWGIPVPDDILRAADTTQKHVIYVWLDALANYMTAIGYGSDSPAEQQKFEHYWPADLHLVGKEITRFHCVYWPAFLLALNSDPGAPGLDSETWVRRMLPRQITAHGWLLFDNSKMSKSKGNIVRTETILDAFGDHVYGKQFPDSTKAERDLFASDVLRYYLLREIPFGQDGSFSFDALITRYNADLANGYGNLVSRTLNLIQQNQSGIITEVEKPWLCESKKSFPRVGKIDTREDDFKDDFSDTETIIQKISQLADGSNNIKESLYGSLTSIISLRVAFVDVYLTANAPWKLAKSSEPSDRRRMDEVLYTAAESIRIITALLYPILPFATARVWAQIGLGDIELDARNGKLNNLQWGGLQPGTKLGPLSPIFPRADKGLAQIMNDMEEQNAASPRETKLTTELDPTQPITNDPSHPGAPPRTSSMNSLAEPSGGPLTVGGSSALGTGPQPTPSHTEAPASGIFGNQPGIHPATTPITSEEPSATTQITIDDFAKIELRVAQILVAERIPKADKLLRLEVDLGYEKRQILSGIAEFYAPEELIGRRIIVITNLAPRKMRGLESHGMLLAASQDVDGKPGKPILATMAEDIALGSRLK